MARVNCLRYTNSETTIKPQYALERLEALTKDRDRYICTEVGQHQMWAAQFLGFEDPNRWMTSGGLGTMGYGVPASIGVQIAHPDALVINVAGEASWLMNMQEMGTAVQYRAPVKQFILNNERLGMVRQWQELLHGERYSHSVVRGPARFRETGRGLRLQGHHGAATPRISTTRSWRCWTMTAR
jgi:acetolactate synthase-1/2/3 large subunit